MKTWAIAMVILAGPFMLVDSAATASLARGELFYQRCAACHSLDRNRTGPKHCGLMGRAAGTVEGFVYSEALRESGIVWSEATLDAFLAAPLEMIPGTFMGYAGVTDASERADLIAYLAWASEAGPVCSPSRTDEQSKLGEQNHE